MSSGSIFGNRRPWKVASMEPAVPDRVSVLTEAGPAVAVSAAAATNFHVDRAAFHLSRLVELGKELEELMPEMERTGRRVADSPLAEARATAQAARAALGALEASR